MAVALSSPQADIQILSRISLAQCLMVHQYQVRCDTEASVSAPSSQLLSTVSRPSVTKCHAVTPVLEHYPHSTSMILMNPQAFYCQSIIEQPLKEFFPQLFERALGWLGLTSKLLYKAYWRDLPA